MSFGGTEDAAIVQSIINGLDGNEVTLAEFIGLVGPHTQDNGALLKQVMDSELRTFRTTCVQVYDTMTADVGDVLANEHVTLEEHYQRETLSLNKRIGRLMKLLLRQFPNFSLEKYRANPNYINELVPPFVPAWTEQDFEESKKQAQLHRLQWLREEGQRLQQENQGLQNYLEEIQEAAFHDQFDLAADGQAVAVEGHNLSRVHAKLQDKLDSYREKIGELMVKVQDHSRFEEPGARVTTSVHHVSHSVMSVTSTGEIDVRGTVVVESKTGMLPPDTRRSPARSSPRRKSNQRSAPADLMDDDELLRRLDTLNARAEAEMKRQRLFGPKPKTSSRPKSAATKPATSTRIAKSNQKKQSKVVKQTPQVYPEGW